MLTLFVGRPVMEALYGKQTTIAREF